MAEIRLGGLGPGAHSSHTAAWPGTGGPSMAQRKARNGSRGRGPGGCVAVFGGLIPRERAGAGPSVSPRRVVCMQPRPLPGHSPAQLRPEINLQ